MKRAFAIVSGAVLLFAGPAVPALAQDAVVSRDNVATASPDATPTPAAELTDKEQAQLKRCKAMTTVQLEQSSKCTDLIKKVGGTIIQSDSNALRQRPAN